MSMRVLRATQYAPDLTPTTIIVRDSDLTDTLESAREGQNIPGAFTASDIFTTWDNSSIERATHAAQARHRNVFDEERNQAIMYYWTVQHWSVLRAGGEVIMPAATPLSSGQIREVFTQLATHPDYDNYTVTATSKEGEQVRLVKGEVS